MAEFDKIKVVELLNKILEAELAGVVRYTHYSFLVFGYDRIQIVGWLRERATQSLTHAQAAGEMITMLGDNPSLGIGKLLDSHQHDVDSILRESLENEASVLKLYKGLLSQVEGSSVVLDEYARQMVLTGETRAAEMNKMMRRPGAVEAVPQPQIESDAMERAIGSFISKQPGGDQRVDVSEKV